MLGFTDEQLGKAVEERQFDRLPREIWLKIFEYYLFDQENRDKMSFGLVSKYFNGLSKDSNFIHQLAQRYLPFFHNNFKSNITNPKFLETIYKTLGFKLPPVDRPKEYIHQYILSNMLMGQSFDEIIAHLKESLPKIYKQLTNRAHRLKEMDEVFKNSELTRKNYLYKVFSLQNGQSSAKVNQHLTTPDRLRACFQQPFNLRLLVDVLNNLYSTSDIGLSGLRWAALTSDYGAMNQIMERKKQTYKAKIARCESIDDESDFSPNSLLDKIETHLKENNLAEIHKCLNIFFGGSLCSKGDLSYAIHILIHKNYFNDVFEAIKPETFKALLQFTNGISGFHLALFARLVYVKRVDLFPLIDVIKHKPNIYDHSISVILNGFLNQCKEGYANNAKVIDAILAQPGVLSILMQLNEFGQWALDSKRRDLLKEFITTNKSLEAYPDSNTFISLIKDIFIWAISTKDQELITLMFTRLNKAYISIFACHIRTTGSHNLFLEAKHLIPSSIRKEFSQIYAEIGVQHHLYVPHLRVDYGQSQKREGDDDIENNSKPKRKKK